MIGIALALQLAGAVATSNGSLAADSVEEARRSAVPRLYVSANYGSEATFSPLTVILNKGFDHFQARNANRNLREFDRGVFRRVILDAFQNPVSAIERYPGWSKWLRTEIFPLGYTTEDARWAVNYSEHFVAGGLTYRRLGQWFEDHDYPAPRLLAGITTFGSSILNEAAEFQGAERAASSTVADLLVFDLGGILFFNWDAPVRFFAGTLQAADWSTQASIMFPSGELQNNGQYYIVKIPLPKIDTRLFARFGMGFQTGLTRVVADHGISAAIGFDTKYRHVDPVTLDERIETFFSGGVFVDRENSLLASLTAGPTENRVVLNVFPGVLPGPARDMGLWAAYTREKRVLVGLVHRQLLGVGAGYQR